MADFGTAGSQIARISLAETVCMPNFYDSLGLTVGADAGQIKAAFHALAKSFHPDVNAGDDAAVKRFKQINEAYAILSNRERRRAYDLGLKHKRTAAPWRPRNAMVLIASFALTVGGGLYVSLLRYGGQFADAHHETFSARPTHISDGRQGGVAGGGAPPKAISAPAREPLAQASGAPPIAGPPATPAKEKTLLTDTVAPTAAIPPLAPTQAAPTAEAGAASAERAQTPALEGSPRPGSPPVSPAERDEAHHLYALGMERIGRGDVIAARALFLLAAKKGSVRSMRALAGTYDPQQLAKLKVLGFESDVSAAQQWYEKVGELDALAVGERIAPEEASQGRQGMSAPAGDLAQFRAAYLSGDGLTYVVIPEDWGEQVYRYGDTSRSAAKKDAQSYTLFTCDTAHVFTPQKPEDLAALRRAAVVRPGDARFAELDEKYLSGCNDPRIKSAIAKFATVRQESQ
jgi:hypothetical protein